MEDAPVDHEEGVVVLGVDEHAIVGDVVEASHLDVVDAICFLRDDHAWDKAHGFLDCGAAVGAYFLLRDDGCGEG